jgi:cytochrome c oxidase subunit 2
LATTFALPALAEAVHGPEAWGWFFQEAPSELGKRMVDFHNYLFVIITSITFLVLGLMTYIIVKFRARAGREASKTTHNTMIEIIWTVIPVLIVIAIIVPSMKLLFYVDRVEEADLTLKVVGYQWYWGYELPEYGVSEFESRMIPEKDLKKGDLRLLEVDQELVLPVGKTVRVLVTGDPNGVIHAWGIPSLKFKRDTIPGRVNEGWIKIEEEGVYYGQCYELCGPDHAFMPIKIRGVSEAEFNDWVTKMGGTVPGLVSVAEVGAEGEPLAIDVVSDDPAATPAVEVGEKIIEATEAPKEITNKEGI